MQALTPRSSGSLVYVILVKILPAYRPMSDHYRHVVISSIRTLFRLIHRIPDKENRTKSLIEARLTIRGRVGERDNQLVLNHQKEMASRIAFLRMITPKSSSGQTSTGTYVLRDGELIPGCGETRGSRCVDSSCLPMHDACMHVLYWHKVYMNPQMRDRHTWHLHPDSFDLCMQSCGWSRIRQ